MSKGHFSCTRGGCNVEGSWRVVEPMALTKSVCVRMYKERTWQNSNFYGCVQCLAKQSRS